MFETRYPLIAISIFLHFCCDSGDRDMKNKTAIYLRTDVSPVYVKKALTIAEQASTVATAAAVEE